MFQEHGGPCTHAIMAAIARRLDPYTLFSNTFTLSTYRYTYQASIHPVIVRDLEPGPGCLLPLISKKRGRPKTTRIRKQDRHQKKKTRCSNFWCRQEGHNKRSCRTANDNRVLAQREDSDTEVEIIPQRRVRVRSKVRSMDFGFHGATAPGLGSEPISEEGITWVGRANRLPGRCQIRPKPLNRRTSSIQVKCTVQLILILGALRYDNDHAASKYAVLSL
jgi:hypothetical protein